ncbi:hypothetical protein Mapa_010090 [Marchantia paleacea]|nr:hypothetical protein Mapa_010090 [Marchantia paleacea]
MICESCTIGRRAVASSSAQRSPAHQPGPSCTHSPPFFRSVKRWGFSGTRPDHGRSKLHIYRRVFHDS